MSLRIFVGFFLSPLSLDSFGNKFETRVFYYPTSPGCKNPPCGISPFLTRFTILLIPFKLLHGKYVPRSVLKKSPPSPSIFSSASRMFKGLLSDISPCLNSPPLVRSAFFFHLRFSTRLRHPGPFSYLIHHSLCIYHLFPFLYTRRQPFRPPLPPYP